MLTYFTNNVLEKCLARAAGGMGMNAGPGGPVERPAVHAGNTRTHGAAAPSREASPWFPVYRGAP